MERLKTREGVSEILKANGLFIREWVERCVYQHCSLHLVDGFPHNECRKCPQLVNVPRFEFPTSNQTEEILEKLGVQVVWDYPDWEIVKDEIIQENDYYEMSTLSYVANGSKNRPLKGIPRNDRELAQAAAVAWFALKEPEKLKDAVAALEQQK